MQRWHVTLGLVGLVVGAAVLAPRIVPDVPIEIPPRPAPPRPPIPETSIPASGRLILDVGLDRAAVVAGRTNDRYVVITLTAPAAPSTTAPMDVAVVLDTSG